MPRRPRWRLFKEAIRKQSPFKDTSQSLLQGQNMQISAKFCLSSLMSLCEQGLRCGHAPSDPVELVTAACGSLLCPEKLWMQRERGHIVNGTLKGKMSVGACEGLTPCPKFLLLLLASLKQTKGKLSWSQNWPCWSWCIFPKASHPRAQNPLKPFAFHRSPN